MQWQAVVGDFTLNSDPLETSPRRVHFCRNRSGNERLVPDRLKRLTVSDCWPASRPAKPYVSPLRGRVAALRLGFGDATPSPFQTVASLAAVRRLLAYLRAPASYTKLCLLDHHSHQHPLESWQRPIGASFARLKIQFGFRQARISGGQPRRRQEGQPASAFHVSNAAARYEHGDRPVDVGLVGAVGQAEWEAMLERQRESIVKAKREGRYKGRVPIARRPAAEVARLKAEGVSPSEIARRPRIGRASVYRVLNWQNASERQEAA